MSLYGEFIGLFSQVLTVFGWIFDLFFLWGPFVFGAAFMQLWLRAKRREWIANIEWVLLEVKLSRDIRKTPAAMEAVLQVFHQTSTGNFLDRYLKGRVRDWFSLELVSIGGDIHFFIRTNKKYKDLIESQIYAQYPNVEVYEVPDYVPYVDYHGKESYWNLIGMEFECEAKESYPIRTYVDIGLDKQGVYEEEKVDPLVNTLEFLGSMRQNEQVWIQIPIRATGKRFKKPGSWFGREDWKARGEQEIESIIEKGRKRMGDTNSQITLSKMEENQIAAIERKLSKIGFDTGIRALYIAPRDELRTNNIDGLAGAFRQYSAKTLNGLKPRNPTKFDFPWQDFNDIRLTRKKQDMFNAYARRSYFYEPHRQPSFVFNLEELATIFHFPGRVAETPTFGRIDSRKSEPPPHLPR